MPKESQLAISNIVDKRLGIDHGIYRGVCDIIVHVEQEVAKPLIFPFHAKVRSH